MSFQFQCPQDHLLEGDESQAGQTINCPVCGMLFIIPQPPEPEPTPPAPSPIAFGAAAAKEPELLHIPCPKGHKLEVPPDMLETEVLCPQCGEQFTLREKDSVEYKRKKEREAVLREEKANKFWLNFAITVAVLVGLLLLTLVVLTVMNTTTSGTKGKSSPSTPAAKPAPKTPAASTTPAVEELKPGDIPAAVPTPPAAKTAEPANPE